MSKNKIHKLIFLVPLTLALMSCDKKSEKETVKKSYSFAAAASASIGTAASTSSVQTNSTTGPTLCSSVVCFTPTSVSGKYYGTGLLIQSNGNGMMAYFGQSEWGSIVGTSTSYSFDAAAPIVNAGNLTCCVGEGDLNSENTYISSVGYLFSYIDTTFTVSGITGNTSLNNTYSLRFIFADDAITSAKRGDILILDSGSYKWMDSGTSALSTTRPAAPVTMNTSVTNWQNPFDTTKGNQTIPVIFTDIQTAASGGLFQVKEADLSASGKTYSFGFNRQNFIMFPTVLTSDINMISTLKELLSRVHLGGLPHSAQPLGVGSPAPTKLTVTQ